MTAADQGAAPAAPDVVYLTAEEAKAILDASGFEEPETGRRIVHCFVQGAFTLGADWDHAEVVALADRAEQIAWASNLFQHDLAMLSDGKVYRFDIRAPDGVLG